MLAAVVVGVLALANIPANAQTHQSRAFLSGFNLQVTPTSTNTFGATNIYAKGYTVTNSGTYPYVSSASPVITTNTGAFSDVPLYANRDGSAAIAAVSIQITGLNAAFTNTGLFKFTTVPAAPRSSMYPPGLFTNSTSANGLFSVAITGNGTTPVVLTTNLPTAVLQGAAALRLQAVEWTNAGTNGTVAGVFLNGFSPD